MPRAQVDLEITSRLLGTASEGETGFEGVTGSDQIMEGRPSVDPVDAQPARKGHRTEDEGSTCCGEEWNVSVLEHISRDMFDVFLAAHFVLQDCSQGLSRLTLSTPSGLLHQYPRIDSCRDHEGKRRHDSHAPIDAPKCFRQWPVNTLFQGSFEAVSRRLERDWKGHFRI